MFARIFALALAAWVGCVPAMAQIATGGAGGPSGAAQVWFGGTEVLDFTGPIGFASATSDSYFKFGIYAGVASGTPTQSVTSHVQNMSIS